MCSVIKTFGKYRKLKNNLMLCPSVEVTTVNFENVSLTLSLSCVN